MCFLLVSFLLSVLAVFSTEPDICGIELCMDCRHDLHVSQASSKWPVKLFRTEGSVMGVQALLARTHPGIFSDGPQDTPPSSSPEFSIGVSHSWTFHISFLIINSAFVHSSALPSSSQPLPVSVNAFVIGSNSDSSSLPFTHPAYSPATPSSLPPFLFYLCPLLPHHPR